MKQKSGQPENSKKVQSNPVKGRESLKGPGEWNEVERHSFACVPPALMVPGLKR